MTEPMPRREKCDGCGFVRPLRELLVCRSLVNPDRHPFYVCRPSLHAALKSCFGRAGTADQVEIALADPPPPAADRFGRHEVPDDE